MLASCPLGALMFDWFPQSRRVMGNAKLASLRRTEIWAIAEDNLRLSFWNEALLSDLRGCDILA